MREFHERNLEGINDLIRELRYRKEDMERINIMERGIPYNLEGKILEILEAR